MNSSKLSIAGLNTQDISILMQNFLLQSMVEPCRTQKIYNGSLNQYVGCCRKELLFALGRLLTSA